MRGDVDRELLQISARVRRWREAEGLTLQELARRAGVATSTIQKIETGQMVPSVAVLLKVARGLGRRPTELVHDGSDDVEVVRLRPDQRHPVGVKGRLVVERLSGELADPALETWRVTLHPGQSSGEGTIRFEGEEIVVCEAGEVVFRVGDEDHRLAAGDVLHFKAHHPHAFRNESRRVARFLVTGTLPVRFREAMQSRIAAAR